MAVAYKDQNIGRTIMSILDTLTLSDASRQPATAGVHGYRNKFIAALDMQIEAVTAAVKGQPFVRTDKRTLVNAETGSKEKADVQVRFRPWWWKTAGGAVLVELRYANKPVEIKPGKSAFSVATLDKVAPTLENIKKAVAAGELDKPLLAIIDTRKKELKRAEAKPAK